MQNEKNLLSTTKDKFAQFKKQKPTTSSDNFSSKVKESKPKFSQDLIPVEEIINGICFLNDGRAISVIEIIPINYSEKSCFEKDSIADCFGAAFKMFPDNGQLKIMSSKTDLTKFARRVLEAIKNETDEGYINRVKDYLSNSKRLQKTNSVCKRFFMIYDYTGENGKKSSMYSDISDQIFQEQLAIIQGFRNVGNLAIAVDDANTLASILYEYFNPKSSAQESFNMRCQHVKGAEEYRSRIDKEEINAPVCDYISTRGNRFVKWDAAIIDGVYHTYFALKDISFPTECYAGWLDNITQLLDNGDVDIFFRKNNGSHTSFFLDRVSIISAGVSSFKSGSKQEEMESMSQNAAYIKELIDTRDEDLYDVAVLVTLRDSTYNGLKTKKRLFLKMLKGYHVEFEDCYMRTPEFFKSVMPFNNIDSEIFKANKRNMTNSSLASLYCFTTYEVFDDNGMVLGLMEPDDTLYAIDNFNKRMFTNPHIFIAGTTGAGKSFLEHMLSSRLRFNGSKVMYILPLKGYEYEDDIRSQGGTFIPLRPGGKLRVNICEIRPEASAIDDYDMDDEEVRKEMENSPSLLAKKISVLVTWLRMLMGDDRLSVTEASLLNTCITNMYHRFGITEDNKSIWERKGVLKTMPIISDVYEAVKAEPSLNRIADVLTAWVHGSCANMNGQTNTDLTNDTLAFDINEDMIGEELLPAFMFIAFDVCDSIAKNNNGRHSAIVLDEVWKMLSIVECAKQIRKMIKILRAYGACAISATQDIEDCLGNEYGKSLLTLSAIKIFLKMSQEEIQTLEGSVTLSPQNKLYLQNVSQGHGLICYNTEINKVHFKASKLEEYLYESDASKKAEMRRRLEQSTL